VLGKVTAVQDRNANLVITINDGTGELEMHHWLTDDEAVGLGWAGRVGFGGAAAGGCCCNARGLSGGAHAEPARRARTWLTSRGRVATMRCCSAGQVNAEKRAELRPGVYVKVHGHLKLNADKAKGVSWLGWMPSGRARGVPSGVPASQPHVC
jgi:hypothetical protein